ncbi:DUF2127 domain-containing protein [Actinokineospora inagensis]|uniref:DUF2127 domain-containing protein n=1 Tax=Actinokineospora inagensis TaxID=103730 RepID=UPI0003F6F9CE
MVTDVDRAGTSPLFRLAMLLKGADGVLQLLGGLLLAVVPTTVISGLANAVITRDMLGDPNGTLAHHLSRAVRDFGNSGTRVFAIVYLLLHGVVKLGLVLAMVRKIKPAYPVAVLVLAAFVVYEVYRAVHTGSIALPFFAAMDVLVIILVIREYRHLRAERRESPRITGG